MTDENKNENVIDEPELVVHEVQPAPALFLVTYIRETIFWKLNLAVRLFKERLIRKLGGVPADFKTNLMHHAKTEMKVAYGDYDAADYDDEMQQAMCKHIEDLVAVFSYEGHSGTSAGYAIGLAEKLMRYETLTPLTGKDDEWVHVADENGGMYQNKRDSRVFKEIDNDYHYFIDGKVFVEPSGCTFTNRDSFVTIDKYPYIPKTEYVYVDENGDPLKDEGL